MLLCRVVRNGIVFGEVAIRIEARIKELIEDRLALTYLFLPCNAKCGGEGGEEGSDKQRCGDFKSSINTHLDNF